MDVLMGVGVLLAMLLFVAAWICTFSEWESTFDALVTPLSVK